MTDNLPVISPQELAKVLAQRSQQLSAGSGEFPFLKMDKSGEWMYGTDEVEVQEGSLWAINPASFIEGYIAWGEGEVIAEEMAPMTAQPIVKATLPAADGSKRGWEKQIGFNLYCLNGEDKGQEVIFKVSSKGGIKGARMVIDEVVKQIAIDPSHMVPQVLLKTSHYKHKEYGKIYNPIFEVTGWSAMSNPEPPAATAAAPVEPTAAIEPVAPPEEEAAPAPPVAKRKRRAVAS